MERLLAHKLVRFVVVGGSAALLLAGLTYAFLRLGAPPFLGGLTAYAICFVFAYALQWGWTFRKPSRHRRTAPRYLIVQLICAVLSGVISHVLIDALHSDAGVAAVVSTGLVSALSFVLSSQWVFRDEADAR